MIDKHEAMRAIKRRHSRDRQREAAIREAFAVRGFAPVRVERRWPNGLWFSVPHFRVSWRNIDDDLSDTWPADIPRCIYRWRWIVWRNRLGRLFNRLPIRRPTLADLHGQT